MNMGGSGDHWYTDLFSWQRPAFGEPSDSLIKDIRRFGGDSLLQHDQPLGKRLGKLWPQWVGLDGEAQRQLAADLKHIRDELLADARERGWEVE